MQNERKNKQRQNWTRQTVDIVVALLFIFAVYANKPTMYRIEANVSMCWCVFVVLLIASFICFHLLETHRCMVHWILQMEKNLNKDKWNGVRAWTNPHKLYNIRLLLLNFFMEQFFFIVLFASPCLSLYHLIFFFSSSIIVCIYLSLLLSCRSFY